jgi:ATPase family associated with various cellular activities (AAA)
MSTMFPQLAATEATPPPIPYQFEDLMVRPGDPSVSGYYQVPGLHTHILKWLALQRATITRHKAPRFSLVVGPQGTGKSEGVLAALLSVGCHVALVPPNKFSSDTENGATVVLDALMAEMQRYSGEYGVPVVVVLEDVDTTILARDEKTAVTPGHRMLAGRLQFIADHRNLFVNYAGDVIGLVFTANRPDELRPSLIRNMRALWHEHNPSGTDLYDIVFQMIDPRSADERKLLERVFAKYKRENLSFWTALKQGITASHLDELLSDGLPDTAILDAAMKRRPE